MTNKEQLVAALKTKFDVPLGTDIQTALLSSDPFVKVPGSFNARYLTSRLPLLQADESSDSSLRENYVYRSGALSHLKPEGREALKALGIRDIFDLRSEKERDSEPDPSIDGVEAHWYPNTKDNITIIPDTEIQADGTVKFEDNYLVLLISHKDIYRAILLHIRDHPDRPFLYHCLGGKDRTGVISALILYIAQVPLETINLDYILTRVGIEPARAALAQKAKEAGAYLDPENPRFQLWAQCPYVVRIFNKPWTDDSDGAMQKLFRRMESQEYKGVDGYLKTILGLSDSDLAQIRENLQVDRNLSQPMNKL